MGNDLWIIFRAYIFSWLFQIIAWPFVSTWFNKLPDRGWAIARVLGSLAVAVVVWQLAYLRLPINTNSGVVAVVAGLLLLSVWQWKHRGRLTRGEINKILSFIVVEEYFFLVVFALMSLTRGFAPELNSLEKFMDFGFVKRYLLSATLPAEDMWMAGLPINYYSFGHFWMSIIIRTMMVDPAVGYNLMLGFIFGSSVSLVFLLTIYLLENVSHRARLIGGLAATLAVCVGGNSHYWWYLISKHTMNGYWYADATRFIHNTIHEFPVYSFVVSDLHGHLIDLPIVLCFLIIFFYWSKNKSIVLEMVAGVLVGIMAMTNTWDVAVYGLLAGVYGIFSLAFKKESLASLIRASAVIGSLTILTALLWSIGFQPISNGVAWVTERSPYWQLVALWTGGIVASTMAVMCSRRDANRVVIFSLGLTALALIAIPEFIYAKDIYPSHPRANTMFKLTYQSFVLMGILLGVAVGKTLENGGRHTLWWKIPNGIILAVILVGALLFSANAFTTYYGNFDKYKGLNGEVWMAEATPEKYKAMLYLKSKGSGRIVEAVGDSYTQLNAVSVFSGLPTIVGWRVHEWLWRGGYDPVGKRDDEVRDIYEGKGTEMAKDTLSKYKVKWILVTVDEKEKYKIVDTRVKSLGKVVWALGQSYIVEVR